jgi:hypothetical protein
MYFQTVIACTFFTVLISVLCLVFCALFSVLGCLYV